MKIIGEECLAQEVRTFLQKWDQAICSLEFSEIRQLCRPDVCLIDISSELKGIEAYQAAWQQYRPYMRNNGMRVERKEVTIQVNNDMAFVYGYVRIAYVAMERYFPLQWCRFSMVLSKQQDQWQLHYQHISVPVQEKTEKLRPVKLAG